MIGCVPSTHNQGGTLTKQHQYSSHLFCTSCVPGIYIMSIILIMPGRAGIDNYCFINEGIKIPTS